MTCRHNKIKISEARQDRHDLMSFLSVISSQAVIGFKSYFQLKVLVQHAVQPQVQDSGPLAQETEQFDDSRIKSLTFPKLVGVQLFLHLEQCFDHILTMLKWSVISSVLDPFVNGLFHAHRRKCHH